MNGRSDPAFEPRVADWFEADPNHAPEEVLETVLAAFPSIPQRRAPRVPWRFDEMPSVLKLALGGAAVIAVLVVGSLFLTRGPTASVGGPAGTASMTAPPSPTVTPRPSSAGPEHRPVTPESPLPSPGGAAISADLVGREYSDRDPAPSASQQQLILTLRAASDPHCVAMFDGGSTCFTLLWEPNTGLHTHDPGARGAARLVDGQLVLTFSIVPNDLACEGLEYTFAMEDGGSRLLGVAVPEGGCGFPAFFER